MDGKWRAREAEGRSNGGTTVDQAAGEDSNRVERNKPFLHPAPGQGKYARWRNIMRCLHSSKFEAANIVYSEKRRTVTEERGNRPQSRLKYGTAGFFTLKSACCSIDGQFGHECECWELTPFSAFSRGAIWLEHGVRVE